DLKHFEELCKNERPSLAIVVHVLAHLNKMKEIRSICEKYDVQLIEDACEALGSQNENIKAGNFGLAGSFSFYYGHHISTIEGGMVVTNDRELYNIMLSIRSHGWSRDIEPEFEVKWKASFDVDEFRNLYSFYYPGFNLRSTDLNAFLGLGQIKKMDRIVATRAANFELYKKYLGENYFFQKSDTDILSSFAYGTFAQNRLEVSHHLKSHKIECRPLVCGSMGRQPFWIKKYGEMHLPNADKIHDFGLYLPNHDKITAEEIQFVSEKFKEVAIPI
ncbi:MAG: DegT/DnrJ/EryC1/StrS family aminotransferase, partial [Ferruginibacter sp.]